MLLFITACVERYEPALQEADQGILVVEAYLENGRTSVSINRTHELDGRSATGFPDAQVWVESLGNGYRSPLFQSSAGGSLFTQDLQLDENDQHRLRIELPDGASYASEWVPFKKSPPITDISFRIENGEIVYEVSSEDPSGNSRFYRFQYEETWLYFSAFESYWRYRDGEMFFLPLDQQTYRCYQTEVNEDIHLANTSQLSEDVLQNHRLFDINPEVTNRLNARYSLLVRQQVLTEEAYMFWERLQKNNEQTGSLFGPQPAAVGGNIQSLGAESGQVIGFVSAGEPSEKRVFNRRNDFDINFFFDPVSSCVQEVVPYPRGPFGLDFYFADSTTYLPIDTVAGAPAFWYASSPYCLDCRERGGVLEKPDFW